jgi:hypothetical protein
MVHIAHLSYLNKDHMLFFRGQGQDHLTSRGATTLYPTIYRGERVPRHELELRFDLLTASAQRLCKALARHKVKTYPDIRRRRHVQWSILQHYEVCATPLLDITHSLRVACSFALHDVPNINPCVYVLALPYITNRVSINSEQDLVNVRLLSICPPEALRPYFQDGYLAGTDEITTEYDSKGELDFNRRLVAKFTIPRSGSFWDNGSSAIPQDTLYPQADVMKDVCATLREEVGTEVEPGRLGLFLKEWTRIEVLLRSITRSLGEEARTPKDGIDLLQRLELVSPSVATSLQELRDIRNRSVHRPETVTPEQVIRATHRARQAVSDLERIARL